MNQNLMRIKEVLHQGMIQNFKKDGELAPIMFFVDGGIPIFRLIPPKLLADVTGKEILAKNLKNIAKKASVTAVGIIMEAYGTKVSNNSEMAKLLLNGGLRVGELKEKQDLIVLIFSTVEGEEVVMYEVDPQTKSIGRLYLDKEAGKNSDGIFSHFFDNNN